jgi:hypothetical protein
MITLFHPKNSEDVVEEEVAEEEEASPISSDIFLTVFSKQTLKLSILTTQEEKHRANCLLK